MPSCQETEAILLLYLSPAVRNTKTDSETWTPSIETSSLNLGELRCCTPVYIVGLKFLSLNFTLWQENKVRCSTAQEVPVTWTDRPWEIWNRCQCWVADNMYLAFVCRRSRWCTCGGFGWPHPIQLRQQQSDCRSGHRLSTGTLEASIVECREGCHSIRNLCLRGGWRSCTWRWMGISFEKVWTHGRQYCGRPSSHSRRLLGDS